MKNLTNSSNPFAPLIRLANRYALRQRFMNRVRLEKEKTMKPLVPPEDAIDNDDAVEILRGWIVNGGLQISLAFEVFGNDPEVWGQLLAETVSHLADAMSAEKYGDRDTIFSRIHSSLLEHLDNPDPSLTGTVRGPTQ